ncbi:MAG: 50S ribosomal protein L24 [Firmicutes bacterium]|nr:50S ribosomal protein L24 [Bacillota bacterium]
MATMNIRRDDTVIILAGRDKGKTGKVMKAFPAENGEGTVVVGGVSVASRHQKPKNQQGQPGSQGGIIKLETPIYVSKVMRVCPECGKPTRAAHKFLNDGTKVRVCKKCGKTI